MKQRTAIHRFNTGDARNLSSVKAESVKLVVTSPPYPMIEMWDSLFSSLGTNIRGALDDEKGAHAFELMHRELDKVWAEVDRCLSRGGFVCINIGDATRKIGDNFQLYSNHTRISSYFIKMGFEPLPVILWRKATNAPNKFMGSGMLPSGAYVTLEHEYILIFRKGGKRIFKTPDDKSLRRESAFFWEERNVWFSDTWRLAGVRQLIEKSKSRARSAAFPYELAYRLINMYSVKGDLVLDPFVGTGTTMLAALCGCRNSVGVDLDEHFREIAMERLTGCREPLNMLIDQRIESHKSFIKARAASGKITKHENSHYGFPVVTGQERELYLNRIESVVAEKDDSVCVEYC